MRIKLVNLLAAVIGLGASQIASAADMPAKTLVVAPVAAVAPDWSGFYVGINGGYGWTDGVRFGHLDDNPQGVSPKGGFGGGQIGYNYQINNLVFGVEADIQGADISESVLDRNFGDQFSSKLDWFGTVRGRIGYALNSFLLYVTGGFAYGHIVSDVTNPLLFGAPYHFDGTSTGYTLGGGVEYMLNSAWSVKAEYQRINLGTNDPTNAAGLRFSSALARGILKASNFDTVRVGLNYKFHLTSRPK